MPHLLDEIIIAQKRGEARGITSICSSHPWVLKAALRGKKPVLIESTCNQVNQFGGYTGMTPMDFMHFVSKLAGDNGFPVDRLILGGDHLGPGIWQNEPASSAMQKSAEMVASYIKAGYTKIHLDTSMKLWDDDPSHPLPIEEAARRTVLLAKVAEATSDPSNPPCYVLGTEVPTPGGALGHKERIQVSSVKNVQGMLEIFQNTFIQAGLDEAWQRVLAVVVQPGVEFGDDFVVDYQPETARDLADFIETTHIVYEVHSTDYQKRSNLRRLVCDHFAILKVGPALTFAFREAAFALALMENELIPVKQRSDLFLVLEEVMIQHPKHWQEHYRGSETAMRIARKFSLSDRMRYYWAYPQVQAAFGRLLKNLGDRPLPFSLLSQFAALQFEKIREGKIGNSPEAIILDKIRSVIEDYDFACL